MEFAQEFKHQDKCIEIINTGRIRITDRDEFVAEYK
jgi:hypothetical protein